MNNSTIMEKIKAFGDRTYSVPLVKLLNPLKNFDRSTPLLWIFLLAILAMGLSIFIEVLEVLFWVGGLVVLIYFIYLILWLKNQ